MEEALGKVGTLDAVLDRLSSSMAFSTSNGSSAFTNSSAAHTVLADDPHGFGSAMVGSVLADEADGLWSMSSRRFHGSAGAKRFHMIAHGGASGAKFEPSPAEDDRCTLLIEEVEALELRELMQAGEASRGLAHAVLRSAVRHALGSRCARALERWRALATAPADREALPTSLVDAAEDEARRVQLQELEREEERANLHQQIRRLQQHLLQQEQQRRHEQRDEAERRAAELATHERSEQQQRERQAAHEAVEVARRERDVMRRALCAGIAEAEAEAATAAERAVIDAWRACGKVEAKAAREAERGRREAKAAHGEAEVARRQADSLQSQLVAALSDQARREAEGAAREAKGYGGR